MTQKEKTEWKGAVFSSIEKRVNVGLEQEAWTQEGERGVERGFLAWKSFLSTDRKDQSDNELKGACKLSHTTTCVYVCIYLFWVEHLTNNLFYQTERRSLWTSC